MGCRCLLLCAVCDGFVTRELVILGVRSGGELRLGQLQQLQAELQGLEGRRGSSEQSAAMMRDEFDDDVLPCLI